LNLLVTENWVIKVSARRRARVCSAISLSAMQVADFGLARFNNDGNLETLNKMRGTMAYWCVSMRSFDLTRACARTQSARGVFCAGVQLQIRCVQV
jgi:hypothetical protein